MINLNEDMPNLYRILPLRPFRHTEGVSFDVLVKSDVPRVDAVDRVIHRKYAVSPGPVGDTARPWYMHTHQDDHLLVLAGVRTVELYTKAHGKIETFLVTPDEIFHDGVRICGQAAILAWPKGVFHRVTSGEQGSVSVNLASHHEGMSLHTNFNIYDLDIETGAYRVVREGYQDQMPV